MKSKIWRLLENFGVELNFPLIFLFTFAGVVIVISLYLMTIRAFSLDKIWPSSSHSIAIIVLFCIVLHPVSYMEIVYTRNYFRFNFLGFGLFNNFKALLCQQRTRYFDFVQSTDVIVIDFINECNSIIIEESDHGYLISQCVVGVEL